MNLEECHSLFFVVTLGLSLIVAFPALAIVKPFQNSSEGFSEFWLLDSDHTTDDYPFTVGAGETYSVFVGLSNNIGDSGYYLVYVKFRNITQSLPDINSLEPSSLSPLYEFRCFIGDGEDWESPVTFGFQNISIDGDVLSVGAVVVNGMAFSVNSSTSFDSETDGFYFQLFFELWRYDVELKTFSFHDRFVGIWLKLETS